MRVETEVDVMVLLGPKLSKHLDFELRGDVVVATPIRRLPGSVFKEIAMRARRPVIPIFEINLVKLDYAQTRLDEIIQYEKKVIVQSEMNHLGSQAKMKAQK